MGKTINIQLSKITKVMAHLFFVIFILTNYSTAEDLYVDYFPGYCSDCSAGSDTDYDPETRNCGTGSSKVYSNIQSAINDMNGGDDIFLRGGTYQNARLGDGTYNTVEILDTKDGSASNYSSLQSYPGEWAVIDGENNAHNQYGSIIISGKSGWKQTRYWKFERLEIKNGRNANGDNAAGLYLAYGPFIIRYCYIHDNKVATGMNNPGGIRFGMVEDSIVEYNYFDNNGGDYFANYAHIVNFGDYRNEENADSGYDDGPAARRNVYRYNLFKNGSVGIKHKGEQLFSSRRVFEDTYKNYGDNIHNNIFVNCNTNGIRIRQDFAQVYNNIIDNCGGGIRVGNLSRLYKVVTYNNTIISSNDVSGGDETVSFERTIKMDSDYGTWESKDYYGYDYNNIIDDGESLWYGEEMAFGNSKSLNVGELPLSNYIATHLYFYRGQNNDFISISGNGNRTIFSKSEFESYQLGAVIYSNEYSSNNSLYKGSAGADRYKINRSHVIETNISPLNAGAGINHPYLSGITIPSYIGSANPDKDSGTSWSPLNPDPEDAGWVDYVVSLDDVETLMTGDDEIMGTIPTVPYAPTGLRIISN